jgi:hypothetical protein
MGEYICKSHNGPGVNIQYINIHIHKVLQLNCKKTALVSSGCYNKILRLLKQQTYISHSSGGWEVQDQGASSSEGHLPGLQTGTFFQCPHMALISSSSDEGSTLMISY